MQCQVLVVGGGPAGSLAALLLVQQGFDVVLVEQHRFPRDKVCGECLSAVGMEILTRAGLHVRIKATGAVSLTSCGIYASSGERLDLCLDSPMYGVTRRQLDSILLATAVEAGVKLLQPARCEHVDVSPTPTARVRMIGDDHVKLVRCKTIIAADGRSATGTTPPVPTGDIGIKAHFTGLSAPPRSIGLYGLNGHYVGVAPVEGGLWNVAGSVPAMLIRECGSIAAVWERMVSQNPFLSQHLRGGQQVTGWLAAPLPRFAVRDNFPSGIVPIGNAAAAIEPIGGEGMGLAMRSAELAAHAVGQHLRGTDDGAMSKLHGEFQQLWRSRAIGCRAGAKVISSPSLAAATLPLLADNPLLTSGWMRATGKR